MKKTLQVILVFLVATLFLVGSTALAGKKSKEKECTKDCNVGKQALLKACEQQQGEAKSKCKTVGVKKFMEECVGRCTGKIKD